MSELTRDDFVGRLRLLRMKQAEFAAATGYAVPTVYCWGRSERFPVWVPVLLDAWERVAELEAEMDAGGEPIPPRKNKSRQSA